MESGTSLPTTSSTGTSTSPTVPAVTATILQSQLDALDDTDCYATAWQQALEQSLSSSHGSSTFKNYWGGRGQGGRAIARRTIQPYDIIVENVRLEYVSQGPQASSKLLLDDPAYLKLLSGHVYAAIGPNGSGKSTLLKRIQARKIPGFPPHLRIWSVAQEDGSLLLAGNDASSSDPTSEITPLQYVLQRCTDYSKAATASTRQTMQELEAQLDQALNFNNNDMEETGEGENNNINNEELIQQLSEQISQLEDDLQEDSEYYEDDNHENVVVDDDNIIPSHRRLIDVQEALTFWGVPSDVWNMPWSQVSPGLRKKTALATTLICECDLLLLDEPTKDLDVLGLVRLRQFLTQVLPSSQSRRRCHRTTTVLMVSHDLDLLNDVATDIIEFANQQLYYYPGNYHDYLALKQQHDLHALRQSVALDKKRGAMLKTLDHLKAQVSQGGGNSKKKSQQVTSHRKKIERQGLLHDEKGHRWTAQKAGTGIQVGSINAVDASTRRGLTTQQLLQLTEKSVRPPPHKAVQFVFRNPSSTWGPGEPLIRAMEVGHGYPDGSCSRNHLSTIPETHTMESSTPPIDSSLAAILQPKPGYLFDCVDLCIAEGERYCILGDNMCGKSVLLRLLAKQEEPLEGTIKHATNLDVGMLDQTIVDQMIQNGLNDGSENALVYLSKMYPQKTEKIIRSELTNFGLSPKQAATNLRFLSGGERRRLCLAALMLGDPQVLMLDQPTSDLDMESVEALIYGLSRWTGTLVMVSHDANFVRALEARCYALVDRRLYRVEGGIDRYLRSFASRV